MRICCSIFLGLFFCLVAAPAHARLEETKAEAQIRYGEPVNESSVIMLPLMQGTEELRYHHYGWRIRSAFVNGRTAIISYMKLARAGTDAAVLQVDEIEAILQAETSGYRWYPIKKGAEITASKKYQGYFNSSNKVWKRTDGSIAWVGGNRALTLISPGGLKYEIQSKRESESRRKANIKHF